MTSAAEFLVREFDESIHSYVNKTRELAQGDIVRSNSGGGVVEFFRSIAVRAMDEAE